jgi:hypothetical protein
MRHAASTSVRSSAHLGLRRPVTTTARHRAPDLDAATGAPAATALLDAPTAVIAIAPSAAWSGPGHVEGHEPAAAAPSAGAHEPSSSARSIAVVPSRRMTAAAGLLVLGVLGIAHVTDGPSTSSTSANTSAASSTTTLGCSSADDGCAVKALFTQHCDISIDPMAASVARDGSIYAATWGVNDHWPMRGVYMQTPSYVTVSCRNDSEGLSWEDQYTTAQWNQLTGR